MWGKKKPQSASRNTAAKENDQSFSLAAIIQTFLIEEWLKKTYQNEVFLRVGYYFMNKMNFKWHKAGLFIFLFAILRDNDLTILYNLKVFHFLNHTLRKRHSWDCSDWLEVTNFQVYCGKRHYLSLRRLQLVAYFGGVDQGGLLFRLRNGVQRKKRLLSVER